MVRYAQVVAGDGRARHYKEKGQGDPILNSRCTYELLLNRHRIPWPTPSVWLRRGSADSHDAVVLRHFIASSISKSESGLASPVMQVKHAFPATAEPMTHRGFPH